MTPPRIARASAALASALLLAACSSAPDSDGGNREGEAGGSEPSAIAGSEEGSDADGEASDEDGDGSGESGEGSGADGDSDTTASENDGPVALTCELADLAGDDPGEAARRFDVELHADLHELADERAQDDRAASARLLEAKNRVERLLAEDTLDGEAIAEALDELAATLATDDVGCR